MSPRGRRRMSRTATAASDAPEHAGSSSQLTSREARRDLEDLRRVLDRLRRRASLATTWISEGGWNVTLRAGAENEVRVEKTFPIKSGGHLAMRIQIDDILRTSRADADFFRSLSCLVERYEHENDDLAIGRWADDGGRSADD